MRNLLNLGFLAIVVVLMTATACNRKEKSSTTGWQYNDQEWGGFEKLDYEGQKTGPNLVLVQGGTFVMGNTEQDVPYEWNNIPRRVTVSSFYMDETEVRNVDYREYTYWLRRVYGNTYPEVYREALPDTLVWREELAYNEPQVRAYFRHPSYDDYPVVGVSWEQAKQYCSWRSDRVNEMVLIERGILNPNPEQQDADNFNSEAYLFGQYSGDVKKNMKDYQTGEERPVRYEDGILLPAYRLPTEAEWEYSALALIGNLSNEKDENISDLRTYPWNGNSLRYQKRNKYQGTMMANFKKGRGDYMGVAGNLNDAANIPSEVGTFYPNDFGLFNMAGNVSEWVDDLYRPLTSVTLRDVENQDLNPYRGGVFQTLEMDENFQPVEKDSLGRLKYRTVEDDEVAERENYKKGEVYNYMDGDEESDVTYNYGVSTLISDKARVVKGGSFSDRAYWLSPGTRRFKQQDRASRTIGFRCAMDRLGSETSNDDSAGKIFKNKRKKRKKESYKK